MERSIYYWPFIGILLGSLVLGGCGQKPESQRTPYTHEEESTSAAQGGDPSVETIPNAEQQASAIPSPTPQPNKHIKVKGIYVSAWNMSGAKYDKLVKLVDDTDLNAMVIDVKNDSGQITYPSNVSFVDEIHADGKNILPDLQEKVTALKGKGIYTIARLVVFKDPYLASKKPSYAMQKKAGGVWRDAKGISWVDPYREQVWEYNLAVAEEVAKLGFDEIQFDYVRFPDNAKKVDQEVRYQNGNGYTKAEAIRHFLTRAKERIPQVTLSADVFGLTTSSKDDMGIGQKWQSISPVVDVISPMIYPSHYSKGMYNITHPDLEPYAVVAEALKAANAANSSIKGNGEGKAARIRPWLQDFTATWVKPHQTYGNRQVHEQIKAGQDQGVEEFLLWNPSGQYSYH